MIDAHCHLYSDKYERDLDAVIRRARGTLQALVISAVDPGSLKKSLTLRQRFPGFIYVTAGVHPRNAATLKEEELGQLWQSIRKVKGEIVAVGEVGPDFHRTKDSRVRKRQLRVLEQALIQAEALNLPLVIHARRAEEAALEVVSRSRTSVLFHCFTGTRQMARHITSRGFFLSFSAILLFNPELQKTAAEVPLELILTETDSPALSPYRNRPRNEPAFLETIVSRLARILQYPSEEVAAITAANARRFYRFSSDSNV